MSAAEQFNKLGAEISSLELREAQLRSSILHTFHNLCKEQGVDAEEGNGSTNLMNIPKRLTIIVSAKQYVQALQELQEASKELERSYREVTRAAREGGNVYVDAIKECCSCYTSASVHVSQLQPIPIEARGKHLSKLTNQLVDKVKEIAASLKQVGEDYIEQQLQNCNWPPSLASSPEGSRKDSAGFWTALQNSENPALMNLGTGLVAITYVQQAIEKKVNQDSMLWFMMALTRPLGQKLQMHFASDASSTSDIGKPEWLFKTAGKVIMEHAEGMQYFQGVLAMVGLETMFALSIEFMRCMQSSVQGILTEFWIPKLEAQGASALWLDWVEEAQRFDDEMMNAVGITEDAGEVFSQFRASSCLAAFCRKKEWVAAWCSSEAEESLEQMDDIMTMEDAWGAANDDPSLWPFEQEVWPPKCAEKLWGLMIIIIQKSKAIPGALGQAWLQQVGRPVLHEIHRRLVSVVQQVEAFNQILEPRYASKLAGCVCTARYFEHNLQEWDYQPSEPGLAPLSTVFGRELGSFTTVKRKWSMNFGKAAAQQFQSETSGYRSQLGVFASNPGVEPPDQMDISPTLVTAILHLRDSCGLLASHLDAVCFREIWKAIAMAATRFLFNDVATEASFTKWGSYQFYYDCAALMEVFRPYTKKPYAHLKELQEACTLLTYPQESTPHIRRALSHISDPSCKQYLNGEGLSRLSPKQALSILDRRME